MVLPWQSIKEKSTRMYCFWVRCEVQLALEQIAKSSPPDCAVLQQNKCGVDILDQMARRYSKRAAARRWPVHVFCDILDLAAINAWIIYRGVTGKTSRHAFLHQLAEELREVYKEKRESMVPKHNEEQSQDKRKASKRHQCQVGMCKCNKTTENVKYVSNVYVESARKL